MKSVVRKFRIFIRRHSHNKEDRKLANAFIAHLKRQPAQDEISHRLLEKKYTPRTLAEAIRRRRHPIYEHVLQLIRRRAKLHRRDPFEMVGSPRFRLL